MDIDNTRPQPQGQGQGQGQGQDQGQGQGQGQGQQIVSGELWRIEAMVTFARSEIAQSRGLGEERVRSRVTALMRECRGELSFAVPASLASELEGITHWFDGELVSEGELRVALAQLDGWLSAVLAELGFAIGAVLDARATQGRRWSR